MPCPGTIENVLFQGFGIRIDTAIYPGYTVPSSYDSMLAKVIAYGTDRNEALKKMKSALSEFIIDGDSNIDFQYESFYKGRDKIWRYHRSIKV